MGTMKFETPRGDVFEVMVPVMDPLEQVIRAQEAWCNEQGWDQRPIYCTLSNDQSGMLMATINWLPDEMYEDPAGCVGEFALFLDEYSEAKRIVTSLLPPSFYGVVCFHEAWMRTGLSLEELEDGIRPSEAPDRKEIRSAIAITIDGRVAMITRVRGEIPLYQELNTDSGPAEAGGRMLDGMRLLCDNLEKLAYAK